MSKVPALLCNIFFICVFNFFYLPGEFRPKYLCIKKNEKKRNFCFSVFFFVHYKKKYKPLIAIQIALVKRNFAWLVRLYKCFFFFFMTFCFWSVFNSWRLLNGWYDLLQWQPVFNFYFMINFNGFTPAMAIGWSIFIFLMTLTWMNMKMIKRHTRIAMHLAPDDPQYFRSCFITRKSRIKSI
jgi:hypothetical protein